MGFRDRFYTPTTARAILSWRILIGVGVGIAMAVAGLPAVAAAGAGLGVYVALVASAIPRERRTPAIDPFTLSEPWRQLIQGSQAAGRKLADTVEGVERGPFRDSLAAIADQVDHGLHAAWQVAERGDEIDDAVRRLDPTALRSKLATLQALAAGDPSPDNAAAVAAVQLQLDTADRLRQQSQQTAESLRLTQAQLESLVARAAEVRVGTADTDVYAKDVDELVLKLEALRQAVQETGTA